MVDGIVGGKVGNEAYSMTGSMLCYVMLCYSLVSGVSKRELLCPIQNVMSCHVNYGLSCHVMSCHVLLCYVMSPGITAAQHAH